jgi:hypothetical protein
MIRNISYENLFLYFFHEHKKCNLIDPLAVLHHQANIRLIKRVFIAHTAECLSKHVVVNFQSYKSIRRWMFQNSFHEMCSGNAREGKHNIVTLNFNNKTATESPRTWFHFLFAFSLHYPIWWKSVLLFILSNGVSQCLWVGRGFREIFTLSSSGGVYYTTLRLSWTWVGWFRCSSCE